MTGIVRRLGIERIIAVVASLAVMIAVCADSAKPAQTMETQAAAQSIIERVARHEFHPIRDGFTYDRHLDKHGVADLDRLRDFRGQKPVVLIWIFADWCPVCHGEFRELIELREQFEAADIQVFTIQCHDLFPARVMVGKELEPDYWFSKTSFKEAYTQKIWWPHLADRAGAVGAEYGVQPMAFVVHAEWINRPAAVIVDREGIVRLADYGTFWGHRPTMHQLLEMARSGSYDYEAPKRLRPASSRRHQSAPISCETVQFKHRIERGVTTAATARE
jgi:peroxiredoxin